LSGNSIELSDGIANSRVLRCGDASELDPFSFLVVSVSRSVNQRQQHVIDYVVEENRVLRGAGYA